MFDYVFEMRANHTTKYKSINDNLLIPLDGTNYFSSKTIHCDKCSIKQHKNGSTSDAQLLLQLLSHPIIIMLFHWNLNL